MMPAPPRTRIRDRLKAKLSSARGIITLDGTESNIINSSTLAQGTGSNGSPSISTTLPRRPLASQESSTPSISNTDVYNRLWVLAFKLLKSKGTEHDKARIEQLERFVSSSSSISTTSGYPFLEELQHQVRKRQDEKEMMALKVTVGSKTYAVRDLANKTILWLNTFKEVGDVAVSFDPTHAALPWAAFRFAIQAVTIHNEHAGQLLVGLEKVADLCLRCKIYQQLCLTKAQFYDNNISFEKFYADIFYNNGFSIDSEQPPQQGGQGRQDQGKQQQTPTISGALLKLGTCIVALFKEILLFMSVSVESCQMRAFVKAIKGTFQPNKFTIHLQAMENKAAAVEAAADDCYRLGVADKLEHLQDILNHTFCRVNDELTQVLVGIKESERLEMLRWISSIDYETDYENAKATRLDGTCDWLLQHYKYAQWRGSSCSAAFWLHGIPGAGKTRLFSKVIDDIYKSRDSASNGEGVAYFFCDRYRHERQDPGSILRSLVRQLSFRRSVTKPETRQSDSAVVESYAVACTRKLYTEKKVKGFASSQFTIEECRTLLDEISNQYAEIIILIDGLDECDQKSRHHLIKSLNNIFTSSPALVKIFISSRDDDDIRQAYGNGIHLMIRPSDNQSDIEKYVGSRMQETSWCQERMSQEMHNIVIQKFQQKSQGMFQWAAVHINDLLELESESLVGEYLHKLPEDLKASYDEIYQSIDRRKRHIADRAFQWMICSWKPLSPEELVIAVLQDPKAPFKSKIDINIDMVLKTCKNLVIIEKSEEGDVCRFAHLSIQEYLESYHFTPEIANSFVLDIHLHYLIDRHRQPQSKYTGPRYWDDRMLSWYRQNQTFIGEIPEATRDLMIRFLGSPEKCSLAYKGWIAALRNSMVARLDFPSRYEAVFYSICLGPPWVCCVVLRVYDVLHHWLETRAMEPEKFIFGNTTALELTWFHEEPLIWNTLVEFGVCVNAKTKSGGTPLIDIADRGGDNLERAQLLLENGADPNLTYNPRKTALHKACYYGQVMMVKLLLQNGANVNSNFPIIGTPLNVAAGLGFNNICAALIVAGADVNVFAATEIGLRTPLMDAIATGSTRTVSLLISKGANMNAISPDGTTPIHMAIDCDRGLECLDTLIKLGVDVNLYSHQYGSPLYYALAGHKCLLKHPNGRTAFKHPHKIRGNTDAMITLQKAGAVLNSAHGEPDDEWVNNRLNPTTTWEPGNYSMFDRQVPIMDGIMEWD
ncbi:hypothetical protein F5Y04DRAFT_73551 [Hypomontagnella monticulosa]|nr:hypothetical protein F5Y04DRAFT_73551 [Hypomontagnella monticulosa]